MQLDRAGLASTYNSAGALSVHTKPETIKNKAPLPYWALPLAGCGLVALVVLVMAFAPAAMGKWAGNKIASGNVESVAKYTGMKLPQSQGHQAEGSSGRHGEAKAEPVDDLGEVSGTMVMQGTVYVCVRGAGWLSVRGGVGTDKLLLENGVIVKRLDVLYPTGPKKNAEENGQGVKITKAASFASNP